MSNEWDGYIMTGVGYEPAEEVLAAHLEPLLERIELLQRDLAVLRRSVVEQLDVNLPPPQVRASD